MFLFLTVPGIVSALALAPLQDGVLKNKETYEIMDAELVGLHQDTSLVLGKHSGRHAFRSRLQARTVLGGVAEWRLRGMLRE